MDAMGEQFLAAASVAGRVCVGLVFLLAAVQLTRQQVLVQELPAVEGLARVNVVCLDKTGTLTRNEMTVTKLWLPGRESIDVEGLGYAPEGIEMRLAPDGEVQFRGPSLFKGYWQAPEKTAAAYTDDGWYATGDVGHLDRAGRLILSGRSRDLIVLPNGFNVYPEDIENALRIAGLRDTVVLETGPGRIEAIVLAPSASPVRTAGEPLDFDPASPPAELKATLDAAVKAGNRALGANQRIAAWRLWPESDFPRTHTLKVKRDLVRAWAAGAGPASRGP